jgi:hypothetical protein
MPRAQRKTKEPSQNQNPPRRHGDAEKTHGEPLGVMVVERGFQKTTNNEEANQTLDFSGQKLAASSQ